MSTTMTAERASATSYFDRIRDHTPPSVNRRIDQKTAADLERLLAGDPMALARRMGELDREWDIDRAVMAVLSLVGGVNALLSLRRWLAGQKPGRSAAFLGIQLAFLFHHARSGWCPPVSVLRRLGFRSRMEIEEEKRALQELVRRPAAASDTVESVIVIAGE
jgi:glutathione S-transferase